MKKVLLPIFTCLLVFGLLFTSYGSAQALAVNDPVVTPVSGDMEFTTTVVPIAGLPGIAKLAGGMLVPASFPAGEAQFGSNGVRVTDFESGKATACFSITGVEYGWGGKVGMWDGSKWVLLPTTITDYKESLISSACATITGNGTYTFIRWVDDFTLLPPSIVKTLCQEFSISMAPSPSTGGTTWVNLGGSIYPNTNSWASYQIRDASSGVTGDLSGYALTNSLSQFSFSPNEFFVPDGGSFTVHLETPFCYYDWVWSAES